MWDPCDVVRESPTINRSGEQNTMSKVTVVGAGAWGTALASHAARLDHQVTLWAYEPEVVESINQRHENELFLSGIPLPKNLVAENVLEKALLGAELVIWVTPSSHLRRVAKAAKDVLPPKAKIAVATKGIEEGSLKLMSDALVEEWGIDWSRMAFLSGPNFAKEVAKALPTDSVVASKDQACATAIQGMLHAPTLRIYTSTDPIGVQVGGSIKNVLAVATGTCDGLGMGLNARAALMTRGLSEMARLGVALGADALTFIGMAGVGDLILTCTGDLSRNRQLGMKVAEGLDPAEYLKGQRAVAEGYFTSHAAFELGKKVGVEMPITEQVYRVLHEKQPVKEALKTLMMRVSKDELYGIR
jgi:glycerol-3-phosphate dehydrogenase (NAD(P)+)